MINNLDQAFGEYERGSMNRRELLSVIVSFLAAGGATVSAQVPSQGTNRIHLNHVNLRVENVQRSFQFYQQFFGFSLKPAATYNALDCGNGTFLSLQTKADIDREKFRVGPSAVRWARTPSFPAGTLEHFCLEIDDFDVEQTLKALQGAGLEGFVQGNNLFTSDPDGILVQVVDSKQRFGHEG